MIWGLEYLSECWYFWDLKKVFFEAWVGRRIEKNRRKIFYRRLWQEIQLLTFDDDPQQPHLLLWILKICTSTEYSVENGVNTAKNFISDAAQTIKSNSNHRSILVWTQHIPGRYEPLNHLHRRTRSLRDMNLRRCSILHLSSLLASTHYLNRYGFQHDVRFQQPRLPKPDHQSTYGHGARQRLSQRLRVNVWLVGSLWCEKSQGRLQHRGLHETSPTGDGILSETWW